MNAKKIRNTIIVTHRYLGLLVGLVIIIIGLTGSLLVFRHEIDDWIVQQRFGEVTAQTQLLSPETLVNKVTTAYADRPGWQVGQMQMVETRELYTIRLQRPDEKQQEVFINPYNGKIMGDRLRETSLFGRVLSLHYQLLSGQIGTTIAGIAALLLCILTVTGTILWSGWRKLWLGFKIHWKAHPLRVNYDIHQVAGIVASLFLGILAFTGFCWNFHEYSDPLIYAATFTPPPATVKSIVIAGQPTLGLDDVLARSTAAIPDGINTFIEFPKQPEDVFNIYKKVPTDPGEYSSYVKLDRYSGKVLQFIDSRTARFGDRLINYFMPLHYGTFGGVTTRIIYVFVGMVPLILFITGAQMTKLRHWSKVQRKEVQKIQLVTQLADPSSELNS